jgi:hypothetical protein
VPLSRVDASEPRRLLVALADELDKHPVSRGEAKAARDAVRALSPNAPLTLEQLDSLPINEGTKAALVFSWLAHRYPEVVADKLRPAKSVAEAVRALVSWEEGEEAPDFAKGFQAGLTAKHEAPRPGEVLDLEALLDEGKTKFVGEAEGRVVLAVKRGDEKHGLRAVQEDRAWRLSWTDPTGPAERTIPLSQLKPEALQELTLALRAAKAQLTLGPIGKKLLAALPKISDAYQPPVATAAQALDHFLRLALGAHRVGQTQIDTLNDLIGAVLEGSRAALDAPATAKLDEGLFPERPGRAPIVLPPEGAVRTREPKATSSAQPAPSAASAPQPAAGPSPTPAAKVVFTGGDLAEELNQAFAPGGPAAGLTDSLNKISAGLAGIASAISRMSFRHGRVGALSLKVKA